MVEGDIHGSEIELLIFRSIIRRFLVFVTNIMRILLQRVSSARVEVDQEVIGEIGQGILLFLGITHGDGETQMDQLIQKVLNLRIFDDPETGKSIDKSALDQKKDVLIVSQFTLYGTTDQGRRPAFTQAAPIEEARALYEQFLERFRAAAGDLKVEAGQFQASMKVSLENDGPFTLMMEA